MSVVWEERWSSSRKRKYYFNTTTLESVWNPPEVQQHYDSVTRDAINNANSVERDGSKHLRSFNNWVKAWLIDTYGKHKSVLDLACGRGQDLTKWAIANCTLYIGIDVSQAAVDEARRRAARFQFASVHQFDLSRTPLQPPLKEQVDVVTCMFALHYFWSCERALRCLLTTIVKNLKRGGTILLTFPDAVALKHYFERGVVRGDTRVATNGLFKLSMLEERWQALQFAPGCRPFGWAYSFTLPGAVQGCTEYIVPISVLLEILKEFGLELIRRVNFQELFVDLADDGQYIRQLYKMKVLDNRGSVPLPQWECVGLYQLLVLRFEDVDDEDDDDSSSDSCES